MKEDVVDNVVIKIGQTAQENWNLLNTNGNYIWMHLNSYPSCHVIIESEDPSDELLYAGASLCKNNTKYRNLKNLKICYTKCSNLIKGKAVGSVHYVSNRQVKTIKI
jgi:predicted ribosome quality control (RQC) complex YloA/Tae2 family protein